ncbi:MAG TPA: protein-disulfide reductase DsbD domain-containing protein [Puia sp.]|nr:protein-disulfide reductase DsbD domain-containing protein [Puia sp.]
MKKTLFPLVLLTIGNVVLAQSSKEVHWSYTAKKIADKTYEIHMTATINGDYHMYSQKGGEGPVSTSFTFTKNPLIAIAGPVKESGKMVKKFEEAFKSEVHYYEKTVDFIQTIKLKGNAKTNLSGKVEFMVCNDRQCLPPADVDINVNIGG